MGMAQSAYPAPPTTPEEKKDTSSACSDNAAKTDTDDIKTEDSNHRQSLQRITEKRTSNPSNGMVYKSIEEIKKEIKYRKIQTEDDFWSLLVIGTRLTW